MFMLLSAERSKSPHIRRHWRQPSAREHFANCVAMVTTGTIPAFIGFDAVLFLVCRPHSVIGRLVAVRWWWWRCCWRFLEPNGNACINVGAVNALHFSPSNAMTIYSIPWTRFQYSLVYYMWHARDGYACLAIQTDNPICFWCMCSSRLSSFLRSHSCYKWCINWTLQYCTGYKYGVTRNSSITIG